ncbi:carbon starvation protein CstA [Fibrobacter sp. UWB2]|jgi:carbon starvation protein CstA|uniref:Carbon starvation protein CstA n=1 Tax=Fibrobacter succinogenes TaxID=833 RepID=A0A380S9F5_FIBSU|nr:MULTISPECIES: carbon starvation CstA family protein [Fibrobacter]OWV22540.1 carbon starvation protein CstA [Fibrobacter sp. UWB2]PWJ33161.1 carbon starvation protein CstA [Fibrobacter succinogenes subsp. elongatus]SUQ26060.1 Carbon starvation protein CstA [Fibrobacter succinogenes]
MITFLIGVAILILGYFTYGKFVERVFGPDDRKTPALANPDGVDRVPMPHWKNVLIQLLNIAGIGPVIGVILGIKFGAIVFILLPLGNVLGGAVHDYFSGMISMRNNGYNVPALSRKFLGKGPAKLVMTLISVALILVGAVFTNTPAALVNTPILAGSHVSPTLFWIAVAVIFAYYFISTFFPIDKIIGRIYPVFGALLILASLAIFVGIVPNLNVLDEFCFADIMSNFHKHPAGQPIIPMLFVTIACGIISGFHSTQSPLVARTEVTEKTGRQTFYGMMIIEGLIGMIWAAGGMFIYHQMPELLTGASGVKVLSVLVSTVIPWAPISILVVVGVIILAITSGDTSLRSLRLTIAELTGLEQTSVRNRLILTIPMFALCAVIIFWSNLNPEGFNILWNYFSWSNQLMAVCSLCVATVYLRSKKKNFWIALIPCMFMTFITADYILWVSPENLKGAPLGFGLDYKTALVIALHDAAILGFFLCVRGKELTKMPDFDADVWRPELDEGKIPKAQ